MNETVWGRGASVQNGKGKFGPTHATQDWNYSYNYS